MAPKPSELTQIRPTVTRMAQEFVLMSSMKLDFKWYALTIASSL